MLEQTLNQAVLLHQQGQLAEAAPLYQQVLAGAPHHFQAQYLLGMLHYQSGQFAQALTAAEQALALNPQSLEAMMLKAAAAQAIGRKAEALGCLAAIVAQQPGHADAWYNYGVVLAELGQANEAVAAFDHVLAIMPNPSAWTNRGAALQALGRDTEALASFDQAVALDPRFVPALFNRGTLLLGLKRFDEAAKAFEGLLVHAPQAADAWNNYGAALHGLDRYPEALAGYDRAVAIKPDYAAAWKNRGLTLMSMQRFDDALASFDRALSLADMADAWMARGEVLRHREQFAQAIESYDRALALGADGAAIWAGRATCLQMVWRLEDAQASVEKALAQEPDNLHALAVKGSLLCEMGRFPEGMDSYRRRAKLAWQDQPIAASGDPAPKQRHDSEQGAWLSAQGIAPGGFHIEGGERLSGPAINPANAQLIAAAWAASGPKLVAIDDLLTPEALTGLRRFCLGSTIWKRPYPNGYLGSMPDHGFAAPLLAQIAEEMRIVFPAVFDQHGLCQWWGFKYDSRLSGIRLHADQAIVNVNFWITPDAANRNPSSGGLVVWDRKPPPDWDARRANGDDVSARELLRATGAKPVTVPYRENRAVIFDSDLFHETDTIEFADGYENRRINITMLFGRRV